MMASLSFKGFDYVWREKASDFSYKNVFWPQSEPKPHLVFSQIHGLPISHSPFQGCPMTNPLFSTPILMGPIPILNFET